MRRLCGVRRLCWWTNPKWVAGVGARRTREEIDTYCGNGTKRTRQIRVKWRRGRRVCCAGCIVDGGRRRGRWRRDDGQERRGADWNGKGEGVATVKGEKTTRRGKEARKGNTPARHSPIRLIPKISHRGRPHAAITGEVELRPPRLLPYLISQRIM